MVSPTRERLRLALPVIAALAIVAVLTAACGGGDDDGRGAQTPAAVGGGETLDMPMGDNFFELDGQKNPTLRIAPGAKIEITLKNDGVAIHNMRVAGQDRQFNTSDDAVSEAKTVVAGQTTALAFTAPKEPGEYAYQCDFHPVEMKGTITVG